MAKINIHWLKSTYHTLCQCILENGELVWEVAAQT